MDGFEVIKGLSFRLWNIKNHNEMKQYIRETQPRMCFNEDFVDKLATIQMEQLVAKKLELIRLGRERQYNA